MAVRSSTVILAAVVVILCVAGTLTVYAMGNLMSDDPVYPGYAVTGTGPDGETLTGTGTCTAISESGRNDVLRFDFTLADDSGEEMTLQSFLFLEGDGTPAEGLYTEAGTAEIDGTEALMWTHVEGEYTYCIADGSVLRVIISADGVEAVADAVS